MTGRERGEIVWHPAVFADYERPFLVVSTDAHPFHGEEYVALAISTTDVASAIQIEQVDWAIGALPKESYVKPWNPVILKETDIATTAGALYQDVVDRAVDHLAETCGR
ncbi:MAG: hypothetical protein ABEH66_08585 [Halobacteriales archaeon]